MYAAMPPSFCASATTCRATVVFPDDSGPKISEIRPRGNPPTPRAASTEMDPVDIEGTDATGCEPSRITDPLPNCFSIWASVAPKARLRSFSSMCGVSFFSTFLLGLLIYGRNFNYIAAKKHLRPGGRSARPEMALHSTSRTQCRLRYALR